MNTLKPYVHKKEFSFKSMSFICNFSHLKWKFIPPLAINLDNSFLLEPGLRGGCSLFWIYEFTTILRN